MVFGITIKLSRNTSPTKTKIRFRASGLPGFPI